MFRKLLEFSFLPLACILPSYILVSPPPPLSFPDANGAAQKQGTLTQSIDVLNTEGINMLCIIKVLIQVCIDT